MSFFGGGTDMPSFFNEHGGSVISTTFDKFCYVNLRYLPPFHPYTSELVYSKLERVNNVEEIIHPLIRECMKLHNIDRIRLTYEGDLPARSGLGTSSTFAVGMLNSFYALKGQMVSKQQLAKEAIHGFNRIDFKENEFSVKPIIISHERKNVLNDNLLLFYTNMQRLSYEIQASTFSNANDKTEQLKGMLKLVDDAENIICNENTDINEFGKLLDETWKIKRGIGSKVTNSTIDEIYEIAKKAGALGGKLLGAGGGGFFLFYCEKEKQEKLKKELQKLMNVPFNFENEGTQILYYNPQKY